MLSDVGCGGWTSNFYIYFIKENLICAMSRHHAESNINILLTRNLPIESSVRQWSHPLMIPLHCFVYCIILHCFILYLWVKSNKRARGQFKCDVLGTLRKPIDSHWFENVLLDLFRPRLCLFVFHKMMGFYKDIMGNYRENNR